MSYRLTSAGMQVTCVPGVIDMLLKADDYHARRFTHLVETREAWLAPGLPRATAASTSTSTSRSPRSSSARGPWLDRAPRGRNETGIWFRRHDEYGQR
ncbi:hypothetical protein BE17_27530 [Sorangium cellulosum]|uniref:Uncharacterized protein n=1 Tax=Sorangium cellulosum TaxID=56 RepID=A0A150RXK0_SORCE|nr:hypothetical protein BE17_27530 [Sorangium cellulosum]